MGGFGSTEPDIDLTVVTEEQGTLEDIPFVERITQDQYTRLMEELMEHRKDLKQGYVSYRNWNAVKSALSGQDDMIRQFHEEIKVQNARIAVLEKEVRTLREAQTLKAIQEMGHGPTS